MNQTDFDAPFPDETVKPTHTRAEPVDVRREGEAVIAGFKARAEVALKRLRVIRESECPGCRPNSDTHKRCKMRNVADLDHGFDQFPFCKHADAALVQRREKERTASRADRLRRAMVTDPEIHRIVPPAAHAPRPPGDWFDEVFDTTAHDTAVATVDHFIARKIAETFLVLLGRPGCGKSVIAAWGLAMVDRGGFWLQASHIIDGETWRVARSRALHADVLVIDDLGREDDGRDSWCIESLKSLMCDRLDGPGLTIVTTNLSGDGFGDRYTTDPSNDDPSGTRLISRLRQRSKWIGCGNTDLRARSKFSRSKE